MILNEAINQGPTIGIIVCKKKNGYLFKYVTNKKIYEREYELVWKAKRNPCFLIVFNYSTKLLKFFSYFLGGFSKICLTINLKGGN